MTGDEARGRDLTAGMRWTDEIELANEFTSVRLSIVETSIGKRLEIYSTRLGYRIHLDPVELESLSWQPPETFSEFLRTPLGPG